MPKEFKCEGGADILTLIRRVKNKRLCRNGYEKNKLERKAKAVAAYRAMTPEQRRARQASTEDHRLDAVADYWKNPAKARINSKINYQKHTARHRDNAKSWAVNNPEKHRAIMRSANQKRRARKAGNVCTLTTKQTKQIIKDATECLVCASTKRLELDHIVPIAAGGAHSLENIQILCRACNASKSDKPMDLWITERRARLNLLFPQS